MLYYSTYVNNLAKCGLTGTRIKQHCSIKLRIKPESFGAKYSRMLLKDKKKCHAMVEWGVPLPEILKRMTHCNPNEVYDYVMYCSSGIIESIDVVRMYNSVVELLGREGLSCRQISFLTEDICQYKANKSTIYRKININKSGEKTGISRKKKLVIDKIVKFIKFQSVFLDYRGYFYLKRVFFDAEPRVIARAMILSKSSSVVRCTCCKNELVVSNKFQKMCNDCKKSINKDM